MSNLIALLGKVRTNLVHFALHRNDGIRICCLNDSQLDINVIEYDHGKLKVHRGLA